MSVQVDVQKKQKDYTRDVTFGGGLCHRLCCIIRKGLEDFNLRARN